MSFESFHEYCARTQAALSGCRSWKSRDENAHTASGPFNFIHNNSSLAEKRREENIFLFFNIGIRRGNERGGGRVGWSVAHRHTFAEGNKPTLFTERTKTKPHRKLTTQERDCDGHFPPRRGGVDYVNETEHR